MARVMCGLVGVEGAGVVGAQVTGVGTTLKVGAVDGAGESTPQRVTALAGAPPLAHGPSEG